MNHSGSRCTTMLLPWLVRTTSAVPGSMPLMGVTDSMRTIVPFQRSTRLGRNSSPYLLLVCHPPRSPRSSLLLLLPPPPLLFPPLPFSFMPYTQRGGRESKLVLLSHFR